MTIGKRHTVWALCVTLCLALGSCSLPPSTNLSRDDAVHVAQERLSQVLEGRNDVHYERINVSYLPDDKTWVVLYKEAKSRSRLVVEVEDRTGESQVLLP